MDVDNVGREEVVVAEEMVLFTQIRQAPMETMDLVGEVEVLADIVDRG
jgi:hypothetical protein